MMEGQKNIRHSQKVQDRRALNVSVNSFLVSEHRFIAEVVCKKFVCRKEFAVNQA